MHPSYLYRFCDVSEKYMCSVLTPIFMALNCVVMLNYLVSLNFLRNFIEVANFMPESYALKKNHEK